MELVSIIVPVYKVEKYIARCINSIIYQTYSNIEIVLIDDGSPDNSGNICEEFALIDSRIVVIHKKNGGLSDARNYGIIKAKGKYITFVDSDDWVSCNYIARLVESIEKYKAEIAICGYSCTKNDFHVFETETNKTEIDVIDYKAAIEKQYTKDRVKFIVSWGKLYLSSLFNDIEFPYGKIHEDEFTTYKLYSKADKIAVIQDELYAYYQRNDSIMGSGFNTKSRLDLIEALEQKKDFLKSIGESQLYEKTLKLVFLLNLNAVYYSNGTTNYSVFNDKLKEYSNIMRSSKSNKDNMALGISYLLFPNFLIFAYSIYMKSKGYYTKFKEDGIGE